MFGKKLGFSFFSVTKIRTIMKKTIKNIFLFLLLFQTSITIIACTSPSQLDYLSQHHYVGYERLSAYECEDIVGVYMDDDGSVLQIVETTGYHDGLLFVVEIDEGRVRDVVILDHNETQKYGGYVTDDWFLSRFRLPIDEELVLVKLSKREQNQVVAITGATLTSSAVLDGVNSSIDNYRRIIE